VDVTISDPPFDKRTHRAALEVGDWRRGRRRVAGTLPFPPITGELMKELAGQLARVTRRWIVVFSAEMQVGQWVTALELAGVRFVRLGVAVRTNPRPQMSGDRPAPAADHVVIGHAVGARLRWNGGGRAARWETPGARYDEGGQVHPCQKGLDLMRQLVEAFSDAGELVLDPFAGVGTTAVACRKVGRRFLGWEIDPAYHSAALRRLAAAREQLRLGLAG
jgi:site-specific DNA-methyltransferase (adenine-specific)